VNEISKDKIFLIVVLLVVIISMFFRFYDLTMDPYPAMISGAAWADESPLAYNARNKILFDEWRTEDNYWNPMYMSPVHNYLVFTSFKLFGISIFSLRLVPAVLGFISVLFVSLMLYARNKKAGLIYLALLISNLILIANSRIATLEYLVLSFILIILGLIIYNKPISWFFAGLLLPFLFFSKITSAFFILSIPLSLIIYYFFYRRKKTLTNLILVSGGFLISAILWIIFWLIPNFDDWYFIHISLFAYKKPFNLSKLVGMVFYQLNLLHLLGTVVILFFIIFVFFYVFFLFKKKKVKYLDSLLIVTIIVFQLQTIFTDFPLRRLILLIPIVLIMVTLVIIRIKDISLKIFDFSYNLDQTYFIILVIIVYFIFNMGPLTVYFGTGVLHPADSHTFLRSSQEISKYIPDYSKVYGFVSHSLALENSKIKPYYPLEIYSPELEKDMMKMFINKEINYVILNRDLSKNNSEIVYEAAGKLGQYIEENFEIIRTLDGDDYYYGINNGLPIYIYKRI